MKPVAIFHEFGGLRFNIRYQCIVGLITCVALVTSDLTVLSNALDIGQRLLTVWQTFGLCYQYSFFLPHFIIILGPCTFLKRSN